MNSIFKSALGFSLCLFACLGLGEAALGETPSQSQLINAVAQGLANQGAVGAGAAEAMTADSDLKQKQLDLQKKQFEAQQEAERQRQQNLQRQQQEQKKQDKDRKSNADAAKALGMAAAALQGVSCAMLMDAAMKEQDPAAREEKMANAIKECAQALQTAAGAAKNDEAKNQLSQGDTSIPNPLSLPDQPSEAPSASPSLEVPQEVAQETPTETPNGVAPPSAFEKKEDGQLAVKSPPVDNIETLKGIENPKLGFDDSAKNDGTSSDSSGLGAGVGMGKGLSEADLKKATADNLEVANGKGKRGIASDHNADGASDGDSSDSAGKSGAGSSGGDPFDAIMAQIMGGGGALPGADVSGRSGAPEIIALNGAGKTADTVPNIFQFASYRYHKAAEDDLIKKRRNAIKPATLAKAGGEG